MSIRDIFATMTPEEASAYRQSKTPRDLLGDVATLVDELEADNDALRADNASLRAGIDPVSEVAIEQTRAAAFREAAQDIETARQRVNEAEHEAARQRSRAEVAEQRAAEAETRAVQAEARLAAGRAAR